jgi:hypothetical protein
MKSWRLTIGLMLLNAVLLVGLVASHVRSASANQAIPAVLRGRALEIVDEEGRVRARILVHGPEIVNGQRYPGAVLLQMGDPRGEPGVKLTASENGAALGLSDGHRLSDGRSGGIQLYAHDTASFLKVVDSQGRERVIRP